MNNIERMEGAEIQPPAQWAEQIQREQNAREQLRRHNSQNYHFEYAFGENILRKVLKAKYIDEKGQPEEVVVKMKNTSFRRSANAEQSLQREILALQRLQNERQFVKLFTQLVTLEAETQHYIMNFCPGGDLLKYIVLRNGFDESDVRFILQEMISILETLQKHEIAHLNIKPDNILIDNDGNLILGGFSACQFLTSSNQIIKEHKNIGQSIYHLQEISAQVPFRSSHADIFAAGVTLFVAYSGFQPFEIKQDQSVLFGNPNSFWKQMCNKSKNKKFKTELSQEFQDLFVRMVHKDPSKRISLQELKVHPFLTKQAADKAEFMKTLQAVDNQLNRLQKSQESTHPIMRDHALCRGEPPLSIQEQYEKFECSVPNLISKQRTAKIYTAASIKRSDFCTNIECETLFQFLFIKSEQFSTEVPLLSLKSFKLKCVYYQKDSRIKEQQQEKEEQEEQIDQNQQSIGIENQIQNKEENKLDCFDQKKDISLNQTENENEKQNNITGQLEIITNNNHSDPSIDHSTENLNPSDSANNCPLKDLNEDNNSLVEEECTQLKYTISLMWCKETSKTIVIFAKKQGDSFEFYKLISEIQSIIVYQFP